MAAAHLGEIAYWLDEHDEAIRNGTATTLRRHFNRTVGVPPDTYRRTFRSQ